MDFLATLYTPPWETGMVDPLVFGVIGALVLFAMLVGVYIFAKQKNEKEKQATMLLFEMSVQLVGLAIFAYYAFDYETVKNLIITPTFVFALLFSLMMLYPKFSRGAILLLAAAFSLMAFYYAATSGNGALMGKLLGASEGTPVFYGSALLWLFGLGSMLWHGSKDISSLLGKNKTDVSKNG